MAPVSRETYLATRLFFLLNLCVKPFSVDLSWLHWMDDTELTFLTLHILTFLAPVTPLDRLWDNTSLILIDMIQKHISSRSVEPVEPGSSYFWTSNVKKLKSIHSLRSHMASLCSSTQPGTQTHTRSCQYLFAHCHVTWNKFSHTNAVVHVTLNCCFILCLDYLSFTEYWNAKSCSCSSDLLWLWCLHSSEFDASL